MSVLLTNSFQSPERCFVPSYVAGETNNDIDIRKFIRENVWVHTVDEKRKLSISGPSQNGKGFDIPDEGVFANLESSEFDTSEHCFLNYLPVSVANCFRKSGRQELNLVERAVMTVMRQPNPEVECLVLTGANRCGKTSAVVLGLLSVNKKQPLTFIMSSQATHVKSLVICSLDRANAYMSKLRSYASFKSLSSLCYIAKGVKFSTEVEHIKRTRPHILILTVGVALDFLKKLQISYSDLRYIVFDIADYNKDVDEDRSRVGRGFECFANVLKCVNLNKQSVQVWMVGDDSSLFTTDSAMALIKKVSRGCKYFDYIGGSNTAQHRHAQTLKIVVRMFSHYSERIGHTKALLQKLADDYDRCVADQMRSHRKFIVVVRDEARLSQLATLFSLWNFHTTVVVPSSSDVLCRMAVMDWREGRKPFLVTTYNCLPTIDSMYADHVLCWEPPHEKYFYAAMEAAIRMTEKRTLRAVTVFLSPLADDLDILSKTCRLLLRHDQRIPPSLVEILKSRWESQKTGSFNDTLQKLIVDDPYSLHNVLASNF